jgi:carboxylesterase type B
MGATQSKTTQFVHETPRGSLAGIEYWSHANKPVCRRFTRVPYALPPTGQLRWRRPQPLPESFSFSEPSGKPGNYTVFGPVCPQPVYAYSDVLLENKDAAPEPELIEKEDCLYLNIWVPAGTPPEAGWPVVFYIHGGWLQIGNAMQSNAFDPFDLLASTSTPRIIVAPTYRLNLFGFLASSVLAELAEDPAPGNYGFWDQRAALEWTAVNIGYFGGDPANITVGGHSAGAYSTLFQLYHDTYLPAEERLIKRIFLYSNAVGVQPNTYSSDFNTNQFDELCSVLSVPATLSPAEKISHLRTFHSTDLVAAISKLTFHTFRACTEESFVPSHFLESIHDGSFTTHLANNGVQIMLGDVRDERLMYRLVNPPSDYATLKRQLQNYYPGPVVQALLMHYDLPGEEAPAVEWQDIYGIITGDCQSHAMVRGFAHSLLHPPEGSKALPTTSVHRYRINWRAKSLDAWLDPKVGVCHGADMPIWWCSGFRAGFTDEDKKITQEWLEPFARFVAGKETEWGAKDEEGLRRLDESGEIMVVKDEDWEKGLRVWDLMHQAQR